MTLYKKGQEDQAEVYKATSVPTIYYPVGKGSIKAGVWVMGKRQ